MNPIFENSFIDVYLISRYFDIDTYNKIGGEGKEDPYKVKY
jgi:hypothetical protein